MDEFKTLEERKSAGKVSDAEPLSQPLSGGVDKAVTSSRASLDMVMDIPVRISMEVGSAEISVRDLLDLRQGAVVELNRQAGEPLDVLVNGAMIARGEVVVVNNQLGIRLTELVSPAERSKALRNEE
ncbi:flagellar motor switch protein FliN [Litorivivens sp.]|uniref:flagellar motor switch protein FliN n=1 Tax=Litorivivens sp. TaxID=2020868 RepID=UPI003561EC71